MICHQARCLICNACCACKQAFSSQGDTANALDLTVHFPMIRAVIWFDELKVEESSNGLDVDWRFSADPQVLAGFLSYLTTPAATGPAQGQQYWKMLVRPG